MAQGEFVSPQHLEGLYRRSNLVNQIWIYGASGSSFVVAIVVPVTSAVLEWVALNSLPTDNLPRLLLDERLELHMIGQFTRLAQEAHVCLLMFVPLIEFSSLVATWV